MKKLVEEEFAGIVDGIFDDREIILRHNAFGTNDEVLLWMLLCVLISYLSLDEKEIPCFSNQTSNQLYRNAILFILKDRRKTNFEVEPYLAKLCS